MRKITFLAILFFSTLSVFSQDFEWKSRPKEFESQYQVGDSIIFLKMPNLADENARLVFQSKNPYPIIFIHGLNSSHETWNTTTAYFDSQYGYTYGGRFDFLLECRQ